MAACERIFTLVHFHIYITLYLALINRHLQYITILQTSKHSSLRDNHHSSTKQNKSYVENNKKHKIPFSHKMR